MEIKQLRHMQSAARYSSYARAATECFTSRQNIAHSVKTLEAELGVSLFERKRSGVVLTPAGKVVARHVDEIISSVDNLRYLFVDAGDLNRTLNLAISTNLFAGIPHVVDEYFMEWGNKLRFVEMDPERCYQAVLSGMVDAAIVSCMKREFPGCSSIRSWIRLPLLSPMSPRLWLLRISCRFPIWRISAFCSSPCLRSSMSRYSLSLSSLVSTAVT